MHASIRTDNTATASRGRFYFVAAYVAAVLAVDTLAAQQVRCVIAWRMFRWQGANGFDWFKFVFWFVVPVALSWRGMDWGCLGWGRWRGRDVALLIALVGLGAAAMLVIPLVPSLRATYSGLGVNHWHAASWYLVWTASWLVGWEFLHRYFLLRHVQGVWAGFGWLLVPLSEGLYHLQKSWIEALGMVVFSLCVTPWALRRKNALLPFLAHLIIELELLAFLALRG